MYEQYAEMAQERKEGKNKMEGHLLIDELLEMAPNNDWLLDNINLLVIAGFHTTATCINNDIKAFFLWNWNVH